MREQLIKANEYFRKDTIFQEFDSLLDVEDYIRTNDYEKYTGLIDYIKSSNDFFGTDSFDTALKDLRLGKRDITDKFIQAVRESSSKQAEVTVNDFSLSDQGTIYDIGSVIQGVPECCIEDMPLPKMKRKLTIYLDMGFGWGVTAQSINNRGIALYNFINTLVKENYIVEVYLLTAHQHSKSIINDVFQIVKVPNINNRPLLPHLAYGCTSSYFRAISGMVEMMPFKDYSGKNTGEYGSQAKISKTLSDKGVKDGIFYIGSGYTNKVFHETNYDVETCEKELLRLFNGFLEGKNLNDETY